MSDRRLTPELLLGAYAAGVFPMAESRLATDLHWVDPDRRGILPLDGFRLSRSLARRMRSGRYRATIDQAFSQVLDGCVDRDDTWINATIRDLMLELHALGHAHSYEVWESERLAGGMYGIALGSAFFGESMFSSVTDGSKMVLAAALDHLRRGGFTLFDTQFLTPHLASLGGVEIARATYRAHLARALSGQAVITGIEVEPDLQAVVQRMTQTS